MITLRSVLREEAGGGEGGGGTTTTTTTAPATRSLLTGAASETTTTTSAATTTTPLQGETWWKGWVKDDGTLDKSRLSHLPDDWKQDKAMLERYPKFEDFVKSSLHHARMAREKGLMPLRDGATPEERADFLARRAKLNGAPEKAEGYDVKRPDSIPEEAWSGKVYDRMTKAAHKLGLSREDYAELVNEHSAAVAEEIKAMREEAAKADEARWKESNKAIDTAFGPFKADKLKEAIQGAKWMGLDTEDPEFVQNPKLIIAAQKVFSRIKEAGYVDGGSAGSSAQSAEAELNAMVNDPKHKYYDVLRDPSKNPRLYEDAMKAQHDLAVRLESERRTRR